MEHQLPPHQYNYPSDINIDRCKPMLLYSNQPTTFIREELCKTEMQCTLPYTSQPVSAPLGVHSLNRSVSLGQVLWGGDGWVLIAPAHLTPLHALRGQPTSAPQDCYTLTPTTSSSVSPGSTHPRREALQEVTKGRPCQPDATHMAREGHARLPCSGAAAASETLTGACSGHAPMPVGARCHVPTAGSDSTAMLSARWMSTGTYKGHQEAGTCRQHQGVLPASTEGGTSISTTRDVAVSAGTHGRRQVLARLLSPKPRSSGGPSGPSPWPGSPPYRQPGPGQANETSVRRAELNRAAAPDRKSVV